MLCGSNCNVFRTRLLSFARDCFFVGRNGVRAGPARAICPTSANSQSQQFAGRPAAASGSGLAGGPAGIARRIRIQRIRNGRVLARHQRGSQSAAQCAAPFPSTPARSALNQTRRYLSSVLSARCLVLRGMALNAAEHIRITLDHGFGDGLHVLVIATDGGDLVLWSASSSSKLAAIARRSARARLRVSPFPASVYDFSQRNKT